MRIGGKADEIRGATRTAFRRMIDFAIAEKVDFMLIAGDVFDRDWPDYSTGLFFVSGLADLAKAGIRVAMIRGNHDAANRMSRRLTWPRNVHEFDSHRPTTHLLDDLGVAIHGQSFADRAVSENLAAAYPPPRAGWFNIGLLHTSADGTFGHDTYAPCAISDLVGKSYDYWALGHVHRRRVIATDPYIVFPGNLQARHVNEPGEKSFTLVTVEGGQVREVAPCPVDTLRFAEIFVDASKSRTIEELLPLVSESMSAALRKAEGRAVATRLRLTGESAGHGEFVADIERLEAECDGLAGQASGHIFIERVVVETIAPRAPAATNGAHTDLTPLITAIVDDPVEIAEVRRILEEGLKRLPANVKDHCGTDFAGIGDIGFAKILSDARALLAHRLGGGDGRA